MTTPQALLPLKPLHLPAAISAWPPAPGWYAVVFLILLLIAAVAIWRCRQHQQQRYWRLAMHKLQQLKSQPPVAATVADLAYLLKQMAMIYFPTQQPAKLTGQSWLRFLDETTHFSGFIEQGQTLVTYAYQPPDQPVDNLATLIDLAESWVTELKKQPPQPWRA